MKHARGTNAAAWFYGQSFLQSAFDEKPAAETVSLCQAIEEQLCECGHAKALHTNIDSIDDEHGNFAGTREYCQHRDECGCQGFWN